MNYEDKKIAAFERMSEMLVKKQIREKAINSYDYLGGMINNMQHINITLMKAAIRAIKKLSNNSDINMEHLTGEFRRIIHGSVEGYVKRA